MKTLLFLIPVIISFFQVSLCSTTKYPADISFMVADLKYSQEHGVKICEIQHGILSTMLGDAYLNNGMGKISPKFTEVFSEFPAKKFAFTPQISFAKLVAALELAPDWEKRISLDTIIKDPEFLKLAAKKPKNPHKIASYKAMMYAKPKTFTDIDEFRKTHPGVLVIDAATHAYWIDKYKMTKIFETSDELAKIKPEWGLFSKKYTPDLAQQILQAIPSDMYVIKPRGSFLGNGVIIISKDDLDNTLSYILNKSDALLKNTDASYSYWHKDSFDSFIVEKYYPSDIIQVESHQNKTFEPTMRVAFVLIYDDQKIDFRFLDGYWLLPYKSLEESGSLNDVKKAYCKAPFFAQVSSDVLDEVQQQLKATLPILYKAMLEQK